MASLTFTASAMAADCIYHEHIIEGLLQTCLCLCSPKTTGAPRLLHCSAAVMPAVAICSCEISQSFMHFC